MILQTLVVQNFRNFEQSVYEFNPNLTIIIGKNTRGKTSLLESVYTLLHGEGFRESREEELIRWEQPMANIAGKFRTLHDELQFQVMFREMGERVEKSYFFNKTKRTLFQYLTDQTRAVLFTPDTIEIITGAPLLRRNYLNKILSAADITYKKKLTNYENAIRRRNKLLEQHRSREDLQDELTFWDQYLEENGSYITAKREEYIKWLNENNTLDTRSFEVRYRKNEISVARLHETFELERKMRKTSIGPQKDDIEIYITSAKTTKNVALYGSRSEQRLTMFWMKLNEIRYIEAEIGKRPLLLLDDVFSELDMSNKATVMNLISEYQTILTTTEEELLDLTHTDRTIIYL